MIQSQTINNMSTNQNERYESHEKYVKTIIHFYVASGGYFSALIRA